MKNIIIIILILFSSSISSQISISASHVGRLKEIKQEDFNKFKKTKTIFLLSNIYSNEEYDQVLKSSWNITDYEIISFKDFDINNYSLEKNSFAVLGGHIVEFQTKNGLFRKYFTYVEFFMFDEKDKLKEVNKFKEMSQKKKDKYDILEKNRLNFARFYLLPTNDYLMDCINLKGIDYLSNRTFNEDVFYNYKLGFLKNYFQFINNKISNSENYWFYQENSHTKKLVDLKTKTLYVPAYLIKHLVRDENNNEKVDEKLEDYFKDYSYKYELIEDDVVNTKILNNEEFYYLRYARVNSERFIQIVNSKTGEIVYTNYITGMSIRLKPKHIEEISKTISKSK
jgi:hypothetical protein